jgi:hypothetical protein
MRTALAVLLPTLLVLVHSVSAAAAEDLLPGPWTIQVGWSGLDVKTREVAGNKGLLLGFAWFDRRRGLFGEQGLDVSWRSANGTNGRSDIVGVVYEERVPWDGPIYGGLGLGLWGTRVDDRANGLMRYGVAPGAKAFIGDQLPLHDADVRIAIELAVIAVLPVEGISASGITAGLVVGF